MQVARTEKRKLVVSQARVQEVAATRGFYDVADEMRPPDAPGFYAASDEMRPPDAPGFYAASDEMRPPNAPR
jgi:hypothetical protein